MNDYLSEVYDWITKQDNTFSGDVSIESFQQKMQDDTYAKEMYNWMSSIDKTFPNDVSESDFLNKVKKKDTSELQEAVSPGGIQDTPSTSEDGQSSLAQKTQDSLEKRLSGYESLSAEDKIAFDKEEKLRPFYEAEGIDYDQFLYSNQLEKERKEDKSKTRVKDTPEGIQAKRYLESVDDKAFQAQSNYEESKYQNIINTSSSQQEFEDRLESEGVNFDLVKMNEIEVNGEKSSAKNLERKLYDSEFIEALQKGEATIKIDNPSENEYLTYLQKLSERQLESGGQWGDIAESFLAGGLDLLVAGPLEIIEGIGASVSPAQRAMYMRQGGIMSSKVKEYTEDIRENVRAYEEQGITKSLLSGNFSDAFFQGSNALAESAPLILSMSMSSPLLAAKLGGKVAQAVTLTGVGASAAGVKSLDLKKMRREGEISISDEALITNMILTGAAEAYFERATLGLINAGRKVVKMKKANPAELADGFVKGFGKSFGIEATSEGLTEVANVVTDAITEVGTPESLGDFVSQVSDAFIIGGLMGGGMHTMPYAFKALTDVSSLRDNISAVFTLEDGTTTEMKFKEARNFVKDQEISQGIRDGRIKMDASITEEGRKILEEIVYGYYAPDNVTAREAMFVKEKAVQDLVSKVEKADAPTPEDVSSIADALSEMEAEGKKNKYNVSKSTEATRARVGKFFKDNGIEIVDAVNDQDASMSNVTETVESNSIDSVEEYNSIKQQLEDGKRKPTVVKSQNQNGIKIKGEDVQKSDITQGKFKSVSAARNAMKEFEAKQKANKNVKPTTEQIAKNNNKAFVKAKKEALDSVPKEVIDSGDYHIISPDRAGLTKAELQSRMENTRADLEASGATVYTITEVVDGKPKQSLLVTNTTNAAALGTARNLQVKSVFSGKDGILNTDGSVVPLNNSSLNGPDARRAGDISIVNVNGRKTSIHKGVDKSKTTFGKSFDSNNIHRLDESDPNYDKDLLDGVPSDRKRALGFAFKLLSSIGGLKVNVVRNSETLYKQMVALGYPPEYAASHSGANAFFRSEDGTIYVNLENVKGNTLFHEVAHPLVDFMKKNAPEVYAKIEEQVSEGKIKRRYLKNGRREKGTYLEWAQNHPYYSTLSREAQIEEAFAEMIGDAAYGHFLNKQSRLGKLRELLREILSKLGVSYFEQPEKVSLDDLRLDGIISNVSGALVNGRTINVGGVDFEVGDVEGDVAPRFSLDVVDRRSQVQYTYDFNSEAFKKMVDDGTISEGKSIEDFKGKEFIIHSPDAMFSGSIIDKDGTILVEGKGGLLFTFKFNEEGYFWASTDQRAQDMVNLLNSTIEKNGGKIYMALVTAPNDKLLSNTAASRGILNLFTSDNFISKMGMSKPNVYKALVNAANKVQGKGVKAVGLNLNLKSYRPITDFHQDAVEKIWNKLHYDESRFKDRKLFTNTFLQELQKNAFQSESSKTNFINFIKSSLGDDSKVRFNKKGEPIIQSMKAAVVNVLTEPSLRGEEKTNRVYAVLEIDGPVKAVKTDSYESYGTSIVSAEGNRAKIHRLDDRKAWYDVFQDPKTGEPIGKTVIGKGEKGNIIYRKDQIMTTVAGVSSMPLKFQAPNVEEVVWEESKIGKGDRAITNRNDAVQKGANDYFARDIEYEEYLKIVKDNSLIKPITEFMEPASLSNVEFAIGKKSISKKTGESMIDVPIEEGREVGVRLDINAYVDKNTWVVTVHDSKVKRDGSLDVGGSPISYTNVARIKNVTFASNPGAALNIARGRSKATIARMMGNWSPLEGDTPEARAENAKSIIVEVMNDPSWVQVGMNPFRHSYFYDRLDGMPVVKADEVVQIGGLVYAKNAEKVSPLDERFRDPKSGLRFQAPTYDMEYTPNALISLSALSDNNRQPEQWVKEIAKGIKGASRDVDTMGLLELLKTYKKDAKVKSVPKEVVESLIATNMSPIETTILPSPASMYDRVTLPGGENYREFLIHEVSGDDLYKALHYGELGQNLIASARVDDRVGPNGEKILFVQEIQSDWVQGTNKGDFTSKDEFIKIQEDREIVREDINKLEVEKRRLSNLRDDKFKDVESELQLYSRYKRARDGKIKLEGVDISNQSDLDILDELIIERGEAAEANYKVKKRFDEEIEALSDRLVDLRARDIVLDDELSKIKPYLPWNQTDLWVGLTIRKLINQASKEGYDQIAFVNGDQSDKIQGHTGDIRGKTHKFYNEIVPKNINNELKRLVKGMKYGVGEVIKDKTNLLSLKDFEPDGPSLIHKSSHGDYVIIDQGDGTFYWKRPDGKEGVGVDVEDAIWELNVYYVPEEKLEIVNEGESLYSKNATINLTPELRAATDKVGPLRFQAPTLFNEPNPESADIARMYMINNASMLGIIPDAELIAVSELDEANSKMIADAYEDLVDDPTNPEVKAAYEALTDEIGLQYESIINRGYEVEIWEGEGEPYANSAEMIEDVRYNKHMYIFGTESGFGESGITDAQRDVNVMLSQTPFTDVNGKALLVNDLFRFVHDFFGHTEIGNGFGPIGEENAWLAHARMFSKPARLAMTTETRGQNSWVNYNKSLRREDGSVPKRGDDDYTPLSERPFADQKMGLMAEEISYPKDLKYQVSTEGQTNVYKTGLAAIAWDIGMGVIKADYAAGKYITGSGVFRLIDKSKRRAKKEDRGYDVRLSTLIGKPFGTHSNAEIKEIMVRSKGNLNLELNRVSEASKRLEEAIKGSNLTSERVNELLHNKSEIDKLEDSNLKRALVEVRSHIDRLSRTLIDEGLINGQTQFTVDANMGVYISRSYKQFERKNWKQTDTDIIKRAKEFLYNEAKKDNPNATEAELTEIAEVALDKLMDQKDFANYMTDGSNLAGLSRINTIFKQKKLVPEEIREFWGEIDNPVYNYSETATKIARTISAERMYKELLEVGDGKFVSDEQTTEFFNEISGERFGSLNGKFVDNEMFAVMNQVNRQINSDGFNKVYNLYMKLVLFNKKMKTIYNPGTHVKNVIGNTAFAMMNGHINLDVVEMYGYAKETFRSLGTASDSDAKALYEKLISLGVVNSSASLQELRNIAEDISKNEFDLESFLEKSEFMKNLVEGGKKFDNWVTELYQKEDDMWKIFGFLSERGRYLDAGLDLKTAEELAAKNIRNVYPNYDQIPRVIRMLGRSPLVGSFVAFQAEAVRNAKNAIKLGFEEIGSDNPKIRNIGASRLAGTLATTTLVGGLQLYTAQFLAQSLGFLGEDEEESEARKIRFLLPKWDAVGNLFVFDRGTLDSRQYEKQGSGDVYFDYINFSSISGVGYIKDVFRLAFTDIETTAGRESATRVLEKIYEPFLSQEMTAIAVKEALDNSNEKIYKSTDEWYDKLFKMIKHVGNNVQPGLTRAGVRIREAGWDESTDLVTEYEILALAGIRISRINVNKNLSIKGYFINQDMIRLVGRDGMKSEDAVRESYRTNERFNEELNKMADVIAAAVEQGISGEDAENILRYGRDSKKRSGISDYVIQEAYQRWVERYIFDSKNVE